MKSYCKYDYTSWRHYYNLWCGITWGLLYIGMDGDDRTNALSTWWQKSNTCAIKLNSLAPVLEEISQVACEVLDELV